MKPRHYWKIAVGWGMLLTASLFARFANAESNVFSLPAAHWDAVTLSIGGMGLICAIVIIAASTKRKKDHDES